jgi:hypothetical protein
LTYHGLHLVNDDFWGRPVESILHPARLNLRSYFDLPREAKYADLLVGVSSGVAGAYIALYDPPGGWPRLVSYINAQCPDQVNIQRVRVQLDDGQVYWVVQPGQEAPLYVYLVIIGAYT